MGLRSLIERRSVYTDSVVGAWDREFPALAEARRTFSGKRVSQDSAKRMIAVTFCQNLIIDGVATLPLDCYTKASDGRRVEVPRDQQPVWLKSPNPFMTPVEFWSRVIASLLSDGNAFIATIRRPSDGEVIALYALDPQQVEIKLLDSGEPTYYVGNSGEPYDRSEILHIPAFVVPGCARGLSPIDVAREAVGLGLTMEEYGSRFFAQGTTMSGIIEHPGAPDADEAAKLQRMFRKTHAGVKNSHAVGILTGGAQFKPITMSNEQAQFLDARRFQNSQIALLYRVPAYMVDPSITSTWGTGIEEQNKFLVDYTLAPWAIRIEQAVSRFLLPGQQFIKFNFDARMRANTKDRYEAYAKAVDTGLMNLDEVRALEDLPPLPNGQGQVYWRPLNNSGPIEQAIRQAEASAVALEKANAEPSPQPQTQDQKPKDNTNAAAS